MQNPNLDPFHYRKTIFITLRTYRLQAILPIMQFLYNTYIDCHVVMLIRVLLLPELEGGGGGEEEGMTDDHYQVDTGKVYTSHMLI